MCMSSLIVLKDSWTMKLIPLAKLSKNPVQFGWAVFSQLA